MRRVAIVIATGFVVLLMAIVVLSRGGTGLGGPRFVPGAPTSLPPFTSDHYNWIADAPFQGGKIWIWTAAGTNVHVYLYDLERRVVLGELINGSVPEVWRPDSSRLICQGQDTSPKARLFELLRKLFRGKIAPFGNRTESFWMVGLRNNSATRLGAISQFQGAGSRWHAAPGSRYGYTQPTAARNGAIFLCDLDTGVARNIPISGSPKGWWNDREILVERGTNDFALLDVTTQTLRTLFGPSDISAFLTAADLTNALLDTFANWNGNEYDFYFGERANINGLGATNAFLLKAERQGPTLRLLYRDFRFQWGGHLDSTATHYLYQGESGQPGHSGNGAVYLRDLTNGITVMVVPPDNKGQYAIPRFYGAEVIYFRNRLLYRRGLDGRNDTVVLPAAGK